MTLVRLGDVLRIRHGFAFPGEHFSEDRHYPTLVTPGNFAIGGGFKTTKPKTFTASYPEEYELRPGDLVISMTDLSRNGDTLGLPGTIPSEGIFLHNQRIGLVTITAPDAVDKKYLNYALRTAGYRAYILGTASGSTVRHTSPGRIEAYEADLPELTEQRAIAEVLGALDDKIAANTKLAETADALAVSTFQRCLLNATYSESTFSDLAKVSGGGTPSTKVPEYWDGGIPWATPTDVTGLSGPYLEETGRSITEQGLAACASELYPADTILMTSRATIGAFALTQIPTAVNQGFIVVQAYNPSHHFWLFHEMRSRTDEFISMANGATFLELSRGNFKKFKVRLAPDEQMAAFNETVKVLHHSAQEALKENRTLAATRDALLPQLMSGKLRVKNIENTMGEMV